MRKNGKYINFLEPIKELHQKGMIISEISRILNIDGRRVSEILKENGMEKNIKKNVLNPNEIQKQILIGTIIGDGCLFTGKYARFHRINLAHSIKQKKYFMMKYEIIKDLVLSEPKESVEHDKRTNKNYYSIRLQSKASPLYTELYNVWYKDKKKVILLNEIEKIDKLGLAVKYFDDGSFIRNAGNIAMNDYDFESVDNFRKVMYKKFNILTTLQKRKNIYIPKKEFINFKEIIMPYATSDVLYKLGELLETPSV